MQISADDPMDGSESDLSDDSPSNSESGATVDLGSDDEKSFVPVAAPRASIKPTTLPRTKRPSAFSVLPKPGQVFDDTFESIPVREKPVLANGKQPEECLFLTMAEMEVERERLRALPPKPASRCSVVYMPKQELAKLADDAADPVGKRHLSQDMVQEWLMNCDEREAPGQNGVETVGEKT